ncbi:ABC transporter ATP-binding protein [Clostridium sp. AF19-22AC]|uniref:ABC transporter ATP-binding protein n=1 Tax=Clostridia TaxID=186801 RepID=UPI000E4B9F77|nr:MULTISPECIES: ABC transporter ATP-binding protein [Clostridia]RHR32039.1 ABC transporter ATP-binding protein [Clostridium sp. AF19-22AC]
MPELVLDRVTKQFQNKIAVDQVSLRLTEGVHGFLGANGAGKTTLLRMLCGVLKPSAGEILCNGAQIWGMDGEYRHMLGYLPQDFGYYPDFSAKRYLEYLAACKAVPKDLAKDKVQEVLQLVGLSGEQKHKIKTFSGGMIRRLGIAQALLNDPEILILDEPTSGLDPKERIRFRNIISAMSKGRIVILSTHIVSDVEFIADQILLMKQGRIVEQGTSREVTKSAEGRVWEYLAGPEEAQRLNEQFAVSNLKNEGDQVYLRIVADSCPCEGAVNAEPGLEDVYLYHFKEAAENVENLERRNL